VRIPNLPTVPGDPLVGVVLAAGARPDSFAWGRALPVVGTSLCLYAAGLIWNDCADLEEDRIARPDRPLPSGRVSRPGAAFVAGGIAAVGLALAGIAGPRALVASTILLLLVLLYDFVSRRMRALGLMNMGICRAASVLLGASSVVAPSAWSVAVWGAALGIGMYIVVVSWIAVDEMRRPGVAKRVGMLIRLLIPIQAALCAFGGRPGWVAAVCLLACWPISWWLGRRFYAS
jgi:4-hydroxybenzoate polyprenyltransferase